MRHLRSFLFSALSCLAFICSASSLFAQKETNHWYFAYNSHLDFSFDPPQLTTNGKTESIEGTASISDASSGGLLFYTDGMTVWNRQHNPMPNGTGLFSDRSSTQAALIVRDPSDSLLFYVFTADQSGYLGPTRGFNYSVVDMRLNGGLGDVTRKNVNLLPVAAEKITAVKLCEGSAYWIIAHGLKDNIFYAWHIDRNGLNATPVQSPVGSVLGQDGNAGIGWLSASPDGRMLASTLYESDLPGIGNSLELFQFDPQTGMVSSSISTDIPVDAYGVSFSPDNSRLYVTTSTAVEQYTVTTWSNGAILNSRIIMFSDGLGGGALKIGLNGKIYVQHTTHIGVIANPNAAGMACNYNPRAILQSNDAQSYGLPNNVDAHAADVCGPPKALIKQSPTLICEGTCIDFRDSSRFSPDTWHWSFPGGTPSSHLGRVPPRVCYETQGTYTVKLLVTNESGRDSTTRQIVVTECQKPEVTLKDTTICRNECLIFTDTSTVPGERKWTFENAAPATFTGKTTTPVCFLVEGKNKVTLIASNAFGADTAIAYVTVRDCDPPVALIEHDTIICTGDSIDFKNNSIADIASYAWTFEGGIPESSFVKHPAPVVYPTNGTYRVMLIVWNDFGRDTAYSSVTVQGCDRPQAILNDYTLCAGDCIELRDSSLHNPTQWQWITEGGDKTSFDVQHPGRVCYNTPGTYTLRLIASNPSGADTVTRTVTVTRRDGWTSDSLRIVEPIPACTDLDTTFMLYAGCVQSSFSGFIALNGDVTVMQSAGTIAANDSLAIGIRINSVTPGSHQTTLFVTIDGKQLTAQLRYTILPAEENFVVSRFDSTFSTALCETISNELVIQNLSCTEQRIIDVFLDPSSGPGFILSGVQTPADIASDDSIKLIVTFDPGGHGAQTGTLVIRTADGAERRIPLTGSSPEVLKARLSLNTTGSSLFTSGDLASYSLVFDDAVDLDHAPDEIDLVLNYNTDLLTLETPQPEAGWTLDSHTEISNTLTAKLRRVKQPIATGEKLITLNFRTFLAKEDSTKLVISDITCNPTNPNFERCVLLVLPGDSGSATVGAGCGEDEMRFAMGKERMLSMTVHPNPVTSMTGKLYVDLRSRSLNEAILYRLEIVDLMGRSIELHSGSIAEPSGSLELTLPLGIQGPCMLLLRSDREILSHPLMIR